MTEFKIGDRVRVKLECAEGWAHIIARQMGLKDYIVCPEGFQPT